MTSRHLLAIGGGGFSMEPDNPLLDEYVLGLSGKEKPRICFLPTASADSRSYAATFLRTFRRYTRHASVLNADADQAEAHLLEQDIIYVGGGDTAHLLSEWRRTGIDRALIAAYEQGVVLSGISAGAMCWFEWGVDDADEGAYAALDGLGILGGSCTPHYDALPEQRSHFQKLVASGRLPPGFGIGDGAALHFVDGRLFKVVGSRPGAMAWAVEPLLLADHPAALVREVAWPAEYLGGRGLVIRRAAVTDAAGMIEAHHRSVRGLATRDYTPEQIDAWTSNGATNASAQSVIEDQIFHDLVWVIEVDGVVAGYVHLRTPMETAPHAYLHALYLTPEIAGRGLAKRLVKLAEAEATSRGHPGIQLHASRNALNFYAGRGFKRTGAPVLHIVSGVGIECFPMEKMLKRPHGRLPKA